MKFQTLSYRRNAPVGKDRFQHAHVEATVRLEEGDTPKEALAKLVKFVHASLGIEEDQLPAVGERFIDLEDDQPTLRLKTSKR